MKKIIDINYPEWNDKKFWEENFLNLDTTININKAITYFKKSNPTIRKQLKLLNIVFIKRQTNKLISNQYPEWNDKKFWEENFIDKNNNFDKKLASIYFSCNESNAYKQIFKLKIQYISKQSKIKNNEKFNDKKFWEENFINKNNNFELKKCMDYFKCKQPICHKQLKKLNILYLKKEQGNLFNRKNFNKKFLELYFIIDGSFNLELASKYFNCSKNLLRNKLKFYNIELNTIRTSSNREYIIKKIIETKIITKIISNTKKIIKPLELDIYLPELQLAIEYNGSYWHSYHPVIYTNQKQADLEFMMYRHQQKSIACLEQGIRLLHLYEYQTEEEHLKLIDKFLINEYDIKATTFSLDNGCYPNNLKLNKYEISKPEDRIICSNRTIYNAGQIKIK